VLSVGPHPAVGDFCYAEELVDARPAATTANPTVAKPERMVGRCEMFDQIAAGGMATIHLGRMVGAGGFTRTVAIKRLHPQYAQDADFVNMFLDEARIVARIRHPNVVATLDLVEEEGDLFIIMEYVEGLSFGLLLKQSRERGERPPPGISARIVTEALHGLHAAHEAHDEHGKPLSLVHRDVSPENILVGVDGYPRVLDFGVARAMGRATMTRAGQVKGKLAYMAPEQVLGEKLDRRTDVFAASAVLWGALTGHRLFKANNAVELAHRVLNMHVDPPSKVTPDVPKKFDGIVLRGLEADPERRWKTASAMAEALEAVGGLASNREVGLWVRRLGAERLGELATTVSALERKPVAEKSKAARRVHQRSQLSIPRDELEAAVKQAKAEMESAAQELRGPPSPEDTGEVPIVTGSAFLRASKSGEYRIEQEPGGDATAAPASARTGPAAPPPPPRRTPPVETPAAAPTPVTPLETPAPESARAAAGPVVVSERAPEESALGAPVGAAPKKRPWRFIGAAVGLLAVGTGIGLVVKGMSGQGGKPDASSSSSTRSEVTATATPPPSAPSATASTAPSTTVAEPAPSEPSASESASASATAAPTARPATTAPGTGRPAAKPKPTSTAKPKSTGLYGRQ